MASERKLTFQIGNQDELEAKRLEEWRQMMHQERIDALEALLEVWWHGRTLEKTYRIVTVP